MATYGAYNAGLPCKNASCKSHGVPHPNCRCYGGDMAEGGEVESFCASDRAHNKDCEYYAEGGLVEMQRHADPELSAASYLSHGGLHGLLDMATPRPDHIGRYNLNVKRGHKKLTNKIDHLFNPGKSNDEDYSKAKKTVDDWIEKGGINHDIQQEAYKQNAPEQFASGGEVKKQEGILHTHGLADVYPDQNMILQAAKGRMSNYLAGLKPPKNTPKLAFDDEPDTRKQEKSYERALKMAVDPMRILDKIKSGQIEPEHVTHFKSMYPEVDQVLQKKLAERISIAQLEGKKPSYKIRQGLSMLLGTPLSAEMSPQHMMAAQAVFQSKKEEQQGQPPKKTSAIGKSSQSYLLPNQAAAERQQKQ